jgi:hypothetical protein
VTNRVQEVLAVVEALAPAFSLDQDLEALACQAYLVVHQALQEITITASAR